MPLNITDYNDTNYEQDFWSQRKYEDIVEQYLLTKLVPKANSLLDIGGGFGRLIPSYKDKVSNSITIFDYSQKLLNSAKEKYSNFTNINFIQGDFYKMPFKDSSFGAAISIRTLHHVEDVPVFLKEVSRVLQPEATLIIEFANKRNLLEIIRFITKKTTLNPFTLNPENRSNKGLTYNFHPKYVYAELEKQGFIILRKVPSSILRLPFLKKILGQNFLSFLENLIPLKARFLTLTPSIFLLCRKVKGDNKCQNEQT